METLFSVAKGIMTRGAWFFGGTIVGNIRLIERDESGYWTYSTLWGHNFDFQLDYPRDILRKKNGLENSNARK